MATTYDEKQIRSLGNVLVTGGSGFLGNHIVTLLASRKACAKLTVLDLKAPLNPVPGVNYEQGDLTDYDSMLKFFGKHNFDGVIHTASPVMTASKNRDLTYKVNVEGTKTMVRAAQETGVKTFVYTSSASVIHDTQSDLVNANETYPLIMGKEQPEYYTTTKALAELHVLAANRAPSHPKFLTAALRPSAMFGTGDVQLIPPGLSAYYRGQTKIQIGQNENLFDFTEITNVAHAHHLALAALMATHDRDASGKIAPLDHEKVDGEAFFITNDAPVYFFDFARMCWAAAGDRTTPAQVWTLSKDFGLFLATLMEWIFFMFRLGKPNLTRQQVRYTCMTRYYNIDKAKRRLGYRPLVKLDEGIRKGVADALYRGVVVGQPPELKGKKIQ
ncbi:Sterol-4-alpha-carboxylate 3-dehydrogenase, decarboxylating [Fulvia fulva]|uniref:Sterol-4-alpha-carboxylate 3-dehydrogenase ERG26, decarboxylating n=1 Tax=Passalora fulva TaxID=5499 RepID=A0A9Q8L6F5_PASFU|nr:Sterol-4-alpha-carboxylate 3-dehydrogenase, decarboxylating [Fulvia fulva]KAK4635251.1 Sterol-4-alpha-carboxylate 3-dehydrogenase, decarboxylating [Fulvia fulva]KAK4637703.1 Sterol-4-alpha-carboxylate 3-dehydrogenase, decarboxylating [Fulvia fulva]UJO11063.1 Sterol-4-alpha-carboxylate 3-dehydrogenase, decarboxylating [Fulvia fulva]WPV09677.1 Sterol-4-alpha-carboxylate 3-dehydrogenase, decarboxylating [Fulvia fulva]WPV23218.1 Sterol-4-alpha-carboxylate 3-dehydrogenase, decarboxylating [Fulvi